MQYDSFQHYNTHIKSRLEGGTVPHADSSICKLFDCGPEFTRTYVCCGVARGTCLLAPPKDKYEWYGGEGLQPILSHTQA